MRASKGWLLTSLTLAACTQAPDAAPPAPAVTPSVTASPSPQPAIDLSGAWLRDEPTPISSPGPAACRHELRWHLSQQGDVVTARFESLPGFPDPAHRQQVIVTGRLIGTSLHLAGTHAAGPRVSPISYDLTYNAIDGSLDWKSTGATFKARRITPDVCPEGASPGPGVMDAITRGRVYDDAGQPVLDGAQVWIQSANPTYPFATALPVENGRYVARVPVGVQLSWSLARPGWTTRTRVETPLPIGIPAHVIDFGGANPEDTEGAAHFIASKPEVWAVDNLAAIDERDFHFKLRLSEPLDEANRRRFVDAVTVVPANEAALVRPYTGAWLVPTASPSAVPRLGDLNHYLSADGGSDPMGFSAFALTCRWDESGRELTVTAPMPSYVRDPLNARYDVALFSPEATPIADTEQHRLGTDAAGALDAQPTVEGLLYGTFYTEPSSDVDNQTPESRWRDTHTASMRIR